MKKIQKILISLSAVLLLCGLNLHYVNAAVVFNEGESVIGNATMSPTPPDPGWLSQTGTTGSSNYADSDIPHGTKRIYYSVGQTNGGHACAGYVTLINSEGNTIYGSGELYSEGYIDLSLYPPAAKIRLTSTRKKYTHYSSKSGTDYSYWNQGASWDAWSAVNAQFLGMKSPIFSENPGSNLTFL